VALPEEYRHMIPSPLFVKCGALQNSPQGGKFYSPFNDCWMLLADDIGPGDAVVTIVECPNIFSV
jgi:E3 ubiquitin-protein ligase RNF144